LLSFFIAKIIIKAPNFISFFLILISLFFSFASLLALQNEDLKSFSIADK